jgi:hypothetical protein
MRAVESTTAAKAKEDSDSTFRCIATLCDDRPNVKLSLIIRPRTQLEFIVVGDGMFHLSGWMDKSITADASIRSLEWNYFLTKNRVAERNVGGEVRRPMEAAFG